MVLISLPENKRFQIKDEDDFLILLEGEIMGTSRQLKFNTGSIFGGVGDNRMIIIEKVFQCLTNCVFGRVEQKQLQEYFSLWNSNQISKIIQHSTRVNFKKNQWAFCEGQIATSVYIILSGEFSIYKRIFMANQTNSDLPQNDCAKQQIIPSKKFLDLNVGDVIGEEDEMNDERFYGLRCRSEIGLLLKISIDNFVGISRLQERTYQQILDKKKNVRQNIQKIDENYKNQSIEMSTIDSNITQTTMIQSRSGQASGDCSPINSSETLTILSSRQAQPKKHVFKIMQGRNTSQNNISQNQILESNQNSQNDFSNLNCIQESKVASNDVSLSHINEIQSRSENHSPQRRLLKSSSQASIPQSVLKCIPISFRMEYIRSQRKLELEIDKIKRDNKTVSPQESMKMIKSNIRAEQRDQSFEKFSEEAYINISKDIKKNHTIKFWHLMQSHCQKLGAFSKKYINDQQNQYIKQDQKEENRPLVRNIMKQMNQKKSDQSPLENKVFYQRFSSIQDLNSPIKRGNTSQSQIQQLNQSQKIIFKNPNEISNFSEAVEKNLSQCNIQSTEKIDDTLSPIRISTANRRTISGSKQSLTDLFPTQKEKPVYMKQFFNQQHSSSSKNKSRSCLRGSLLKVNKIQSECNSQTNLELSNSKINVEENKVLIIQTNENHNKASTHSIAITPSFYFNRQKRQFIQKTISQEPSQSSLNQSNLISFVTNNQQNQPEFLESPVRSAIQSIYSPSKRPSKAGIQVPISDYSQISRKYQIEREENGKQQLLKRFINSYAQTSQKLKSLNTIIKKNNM